MPSEVGWRLLVEIAGAVQEEPALPPEFAFLSSQFSVGMVSAFL